MSKIAFALSLLLIGSFAQEELQNSTDTQEARGHWGLPHRRCFNRNEEFKFCGTACEPTCENPNPICTRQCVNNVCQCALGHVRDTSTRQCVRQFQCRASVTTPRPGGFCGLNEERKSCGTACEPTCNNPNPICSMQCVPNVCQCRSGYIRDSFGQCVLRQMCAPSVSTPRPGGQCGLNEERKSCGTACEPTCANPNPICTQQCVPNVCQCRAGYIRDNSGRCVLRNQCSTSPTIPPRCQANEVFRECGTSCEPTCFRPQPTICTMQCILNVCQCATGFVRDPTTNQCVLENQCRSSPFPTTTSRPRQCAPNETFRSCGTACEPTCQNPSPQFCTEQCILNVCQCSPGFVRGRNGCVRRQQC